MGGTDGTGSDRLTNLQNQFSRTFKLFLFLTLQRKEKEFSKNSWESLKVHRLKSGNRVKYFFIVLKKDNICNIYSSRKCLLFVKKPGN